MGNRHTWSLDDRVRVATEVLKRELIITDAYLARELCTLMSRLRSICKRLQAAGALTYSRVEKGYRVAQVPENLATILEVKHKCVSKPVNEPKITKRKCRGCGRRLFEDRYFNCKTCLPQLKCLDERWIYEGDENDDDESEEASC